MQKPIDDDLNTDDDADVRPMKTELAGMVVPFVMTSGGKLEISY